MSGDDRYEQNLTRQNKTLPTAGDVANRRDVVPTGVSIKSTGAFKVSLMGLQVRGQVTEKDWENFGENLFSVTGSLPWLYGDFMVHGNEAWGAYKRLAAKYGVNWRRLQEYAYVCRNVDLSLRNDKLSFSHHRAVAPLFDETNPEGSRAVQAEALNYAVDNGLNVTEFREAVEHIINGTEPATPALPDKITGVPMWRKRFDAAEAKLFQRWEKMTMKEQNQVIEHLEQTLQTLKTHKRARKNG
jgi:hypothetical protein